MVVVATTTSTPIKSTNPIFNFTTPSRNDNIANIVNNQINKINQPLNNNKISNACHISNMDPIEGKAIFNNVLISYLCDNGTGRTLISESAFVKMKLDDDSIVLNPYIGPRLKSATQYLIVFGELKLKKSFCFLSLQVFETQI